MDVLFDWVSKWGDVISFLIQIAILLVAIIQLIITANSQRRDPPKS
jgi:hypothetical protein